LKGAKAAALALLVTVSFLAGFRWLGSAGEAFWLLFPLWVLCGSVGLRIIPLPRQPATTRAGRWLVLAILILFPAGYYAGMVRYAGGRFEWKELLVAIYFFALSLEFFLLYLFRGFELACRLIPASYTRLKRTGLRALAKTGLYALLLPFLLSTLSLHRVKIASAPPEAVDFSYHEVAFPSRGERPVCLRGWFFPLEKPNGTVIACHGVAGNRADILPIVLLLLQADFQVLTFDFRGHGESDGHTVTYGEREREDVLGAWDYVLSRHDVDRERIFGFGVSMGAASLLLALPDLPDLKAAVADSSFSDLEKMIRWQYRYLPGPAAEPLAFLTEVFGWIETGRWASRSSPLRAIEKVSIPLLFFHGGRDRVIPSSSTEELHRAYRGPKQLRIEPEAEHGGVFAESELRYRGEVRKFFLAAVEKTP
jgi:hypothetical protein